MLQRRWEGTIITDLKTARWLPGGGIALYVIYLLLGRPAQVLPGLLALGAAVAGLAFARRQPGPNRQADRPAQGQPDKSNGKRPDQKPEHDEEGNHHHVPAMHRQGGASSTSAEAEAIDGRDETAGETGDPPRWQEPFSAIKWQKVTVLIGAAVLMFLGQVQIFRDPLDVPVSGAYLMMWLGLAGFFYALNGTILPGDGLIPIPDGPVPVQVKKRWLVASFVFAAITAWRSTLTSPEAYLGEHLLFWFLSMVAFVVSVKPFEGEKRPTDNNPIQRWEYGLLLALLVVGFAIRWINIEKVPHVLDQDEAIFAHEGAVIRFENFLATPFEPGVHSHPRLYQAMIGLSTAALGDTLPGARLPSVILGALGLPALYLLGRELFGWQGGLVAAGFMTGWSFHVEFSRLAMNQPADPLFGTLSFYFLLRGLRRASTVDYALSGVFLGIAQLFYLGGRLVPLVMIAYLAFIFVAQRPVIKKQWRRILLVPLGLFIITIPQNYYLLYFQEPITTRADKSILAGELQDTINSGGAVVQYLGDQVKYSFAALFSTGDRSGWYGRGSNVLGPFGGPLLLIGTVMSIIVIWKRPKWSLPLGWALAVVISGSTLSVTPPQYERYFPAVSAFALLVAMGVLSAAAGLTKFMKRPEWTGRIALGLGAALFAANLGFYVFDYVPAGNYVANRQDWVTNRVAAEMVAGSDEGRQIALVGQFATGMENTNVVQYFMVGKPYVVFNTTVEDLLKQMSRTQPYEFLVAPERTDELAEIIGAWPGGNTFEVYLDEDRSLGFYLYMSAGTPPAVLSVPTDATGRNK